MKIRINQLRQRLDDWQMPLEEVAARALRVKRQDVVSARLLRKSVDARDKGDVHFSLTLEAETARPVRLPKGAVEVGEELPPSALRAATSLGEGGLAAPAQKAPSLRELSPQATEGVENAPAPIVVGMGPAGLFAALTLARAGMRPLVVERGKRVEEREKDVAAFFAGGPFNPKSNVQFGEGGAGTFSDGKLNSGIKDPRCRAVLEEMHRAGAPESILWQAKPHVGTDHLKTVVRGLREEILALGGDVRFETALTGLEIRDGRVTGATLTGPEGAERIAVDGVILAVGHSARDTFEMVKDAGAAMSRKPFAIGARIEHRQKMIDRAQYGAAAEHPALGAADYKLAVHLESGRSVYTFCMCPGGVVVAAASEEGGVVVNGMSLYARDGENANSALLVNVLPEDFGGDDPLAGVAFQRKWEQAAFRAGGGDYRAPAQKVGDFLAKKPSDGPGTVAPSYRPGVKWGSLDECLPGFVTDSMREALPLLDRKLKGFSHPDAVLTGVETRSSSPVRIERDAACQSNLRGLYPCGEGAGYAGGILSAAVDGIKCAEALLRESGEWRVEMKIRAALFDLDGTLLDSSGVWQDVDARFFAARGIAADHAEYARAVQGMSFRETAVYTVERYGLKESVEAVMSEWMEMTREEYARHVAMKPGARDYLRFLKRGGVKLAVVTANRAELFMPTLERWGVAELFDAFCTSAEAGDTSKSDGALYRLAAERLSVEPKDCAVFEDVLDGIAGAKRCGMRAFAVRDAATEHSRDEIDALADAALDDFTALIPPDALRRRCVIFTALCEGDPARAYAPLPGDYVLCADAGWQLARKQGVAPDLVIGDFDSSEEPAGEKTLRVLVEKDDSDTMLCLKRGLSLGFDDFLIVGGFGGRLDHTLANLQTLHYAARRGARAVMRDGLRWATALYNEGIRVPADVLDGDGPVKLSVFSLTDTCRGVTIRGTKYLLEDGTLINAFPLGLSNEFAAPAAEIAVKDGALLVTVCVV